MPLRLARTLSPAGVILAGFERLPADGPRRGVPACPVPSDHPPRHQGSAAHRGAREMREIRGEDEMGTSV